MNRMLRAAIICGIVPIVVGVMIFLSWVIWPLRMLMDAGLLWLVVGPVIILAGVVLGVIYAVLSVRRRAVSRRALKWRTLGLLGLYLGNFLIAGAVVAAASRVKDLADRYTITVVNSSPLALEEIRLKAPGVEVLYEDIPSGRKVARQFLLPREVGQMTFSCLYGDEPRQEVFEGYFTTGVVADGTITVGLAGDITYKGAFRAD